MENSTAGTKAVTKVAVANSGESSAFLLNKRDFMLAQVLEIGKHVAWDGGYDFRGLTVGRHKDGWLVAVKAIRHGRPYVAFIIGHSYQDALFMAGEWAYEGRFEWKHDKYPSRFVKQELGM